MKHLSLVAFVFLIILSACGPSKKITTKHTVALDEVTVSAKNSVYRTAATRVWDITHTRVALSFDWKNKTADGREWVNIHPYFYPTDTLVLDAKSMRIDTVMLQTATGNTLLNYTYKNDELMIKFAKTWQSTDTISLYIKYTAMPYAEVTGGSSAISDDRGLYFINTDYSIPHKPAQIWTQGETESNSHWLPTIDRPNERFTVQVELTVPDSFKTLSNGYMASHTWQRGGLRTDVWKMDMPIQTYAIMFAIGKFDIIKDQWNGRDVNYYVEPEYAPYARKIFKNTPEMIQHFSDITGVLYPWNKYDQVIVRDYVSGAMENTTASLFGEFMNQNAREIADRDFEDVVSHELFHQWFGDYVTCESWSNITVNESFANYSEQLWRRYKYGNEYADQLAYEDLMKYIIASKYSDPQLVRFYYNDREDVFDRISYEKGGAILNYLNQLMGDKAFDKAMNIYLTKNALQPAEATNWRLAIEEATGADWNWFFNEWYYHAGHPVVTVDYDYDDDAKQVIVHVKQVQLDSNFTYQLPLKTAVIYGNEKEIVDWDIQDRKETFIYPYKDGVKPAIVPDVRHWLVGSLTDNKPMQYFKTQYEQCDDYINKRLALGAAWRNISDTTAQQVIDEALNGHDALIQEYFLGVLTRVDGEKYQDKWKSQVMFLALNSGSNNVRGAAFRVLGAWKVSAAKQNMLDALYDSSYDVSGSALNALYAIDKDTAYVLAKQLLKTKPEAELQGAIWSILGKQGNDNDVALFAKEAPYLYGHKKFALGGGLYSYIENVKNDVSFDQAVSVMTRIIIDENIKSYRLALASYLFRLEKGYKQKAEKENKKEAEHTKQRADLIKGYIQKVIDAEKDGDNLKRLKEMDKSDSTLQ